MMRLTHAFVTLISSTFLPGFRARVMSTQKGVFQTIPSGVPFTDTSARFFTSPRSSHTWAPLADQSAGASIVFVYVPFPEKYLTPSSELLLQEINWSRAIFVGAPRFGSKLRSHGPSTVASVVSTIFGRLREVVLAGLRNTTNTVPQGSRCRGTVVRLSAIWNDAGSVVPVSACHSSASFPVTRKLASKTSS